LKEEGRERRERHFQHRRNLIREDGKDRPRKRDRGTKGQRWRKSSLIRERAPSPLERKRGIHIHMRINIYRYTYVSSEKHAYTHTYAYICAHAK
jgi:hypothetical protein